MILGIYHVPLLKILGVYLGFSFSSGIVFIAKWEVTEVEILTKHLVLMLDYVSSSLLQAILYLLRAMEYEERTTEMDK